MTGRALPTSPLRWASGSRSSRTTTTRRTSRAWSAALPSTPPTRCSPGGAAVRKVLVPDYTWANTAVEAQVPTDVDGELVHAKPGEEAELVELVGACEAILTCFKRVTPAVVRAGERLKVIGRY